jgi:hypothetical protein
MTVLSYDELVVNSTVYTAQEDLEIEYFFDRVNKLLTQHFEADIESYEFFIEGRTYYDWRDAMISRIIVEFADQGWIMSPLGGASPCRLDPDDGIERYGLNILFTLEV